MCDGDDDEDDDEDDGNRSTPAASCRLLRIFEVVNVIIFILLTRSLSFVLAKILDSLTSDKK